MHARALLSMLLLLCVPVHAASEVLDFEHLPRDQIRVESPIAEDGYIVEMVSDSRCTFPSLQFEYYPFPTSENLALISPIVDSWRYCGEDLRWPLSVVIRRPYDQTFDARAIDVACGGNAPFACPEVVLLRGIKPSGAAVEQTCAVESFNVFSTCALDGQFTGLVRLEWLVEGLSRAYPVYYDNIVVESGASLPTPWANVAPRDVDFGPAVVGGANSVRVSISNEGTAPLNVASIATTDPLAAPFSIVQDACTGRSLQTDRQCAFTVGFAPTGVGEYSDTFTIESNDPYAPSIRVNVRGVAVTIAGQIVGLNRVNVTCENKTRKSRVTFQVGASEAGLWDCQLAGLPVSSGDEIQIKVKGIAE